MRPGSNTIDHDSPGARPTAAPDRPSNEAAAVKFVNILPSLVLVLAAAAPSAAQTLHQSERHDFIVEVITDKLVYPWSVAFLPNGDFLVTERPGRLNRVTAAGDVQRVNGAPSVAASGQGGLLDVALDPAFEDNARIYLCYAAGGIAGSGTELASAVLDGDALRELETLFVAEPKVHGGRHFGCRIAFDETGHLYLALGERGDRDHAQDLSTHHGGVMRLNRDGSVPRDNPFVNRDDARDEIFTYGNRNPQGMARHPDTGDLWELEHGPQGGDELNILVRGGNYGWPVVSYGGEYGSGRQVGEGETKAGIEDAVYYWDPSIAPSGLAFYRGDAFPGWNDSLFVGALKFRLLSRLELDGERVVSEEQLLEGELGRIRDVRVGPDGYVYLLTDESPGVLARLKPGS